MFRAVLIAGFLTGLVNSTWADEDIRFATQIRPILSDKCFQCHGPDAGKRAADLRLDDEHSAKSDLPSGVKAIVPGDLSASAIIQRVLSSDPDLQMPPPETGKQLTKTEVQLLKRWIEAGAPWGQHWAFEPIVRPSVPDKPRNEMSRNAIDYFVNSRFTELGLTANAEADRRSLLRRVTLDLTGLPPTPSELNAFTADTSESAYENVVDRLLRSPRYGEHMARYWLDAARYGDTHGLHLDNYREMWAYRDWVVNAFNSNMPFDQFAIEQLAGDLLPNPSDDQLIATGFNRCHVTTGEGGSIDAEVEVRNTNDRVITTGAVFLGLTLDCCRCHSHKFDPITIHEYYALSAYFNSIDGNPLDGNSKEHAPTLKVLTPEQKQQISQLEESHLQLRKQIDAVVNATTFREPEIPGEPVSSEPVEVIVVDDSAPAGTNASGTTPWTFAKKPAPVFSGEVSQIRTAVGLSQHYFEGSKSPLKINEGDVFFAHVFIDPANPPKEIMLQWNDGKSWNHRAYWGSNSINWGEDNTPSRLRKGDLPKAGEWLQLIVTAAEVGLSPGAQVTGWAFTQFDGTVYWDRSGIRTRSNQKPAYDSYVAWQTAQKQSAVSDLPAPLRDVLVTAPDQRDPDKERGLKNYFLEHAYVGTRQSLSPLHQKWMEIDQQLKVIRDNASTTLIFRERSPVKPAFVLNRGEYDQSRDEVSRGVPAVFPSLPEGSPNNRLGLAKWLTAPDHPLMSRVTVNRFWQQLFGTGIVKTSEDFGSQGELPSHPALLDWLSSEFMQPESSDAQHNWDTKHLMKTIVLSAAYRRDAKASDAGLTLDPSNRFFARGPRFRLDAETLRDQALFLSGLLVEQTGGPGVKPPQPDGLWQAVGYSGSNTVRFVKDTGREKVHRRTLYTFIKRTAPPPQLAIMDAPSRESCVLRRERTNSPMQALLLMNDPQYLECARVLAEHTMKEAGPSTAERLKWMFQRCLLREPDESVVEELAQDLTAYREEFDANSKAARALITVGEVAADAQLTPEELAAWTMIASTLLNLDEVVSK